MTNDGKEFEFGTSVHDKAKYIESLFKNDTTLNTSSVQEGDGVRNQSTPPSFELSNEHDQSIHVRPYADMIEKMSYVQKADFAKRALELERDNATLKKMFEEVSRERNAWLQDSTEARLLISEHGYELETLRGQIVDRDMELKETKEKLTEYENQWHPSKQEQIDDLAEELNNMEGRANALEEWLSEYRDQLKKENAFHKNTGIINAINELLKYE